jgi:TolB-like protein
MKHFLKLPALFAILLMIPLCASAELKKSKIAVFDFQLQGEEFNRKNMGATVAEWFISAVIQEGRFDVVDREQIEKARETQQFPKSGRFDTSSATQIGKVLGVEFVITGSVRTSHDTTEINIQIIDVENAAIVTDENLGIPTGLNLQDKVMEMSRKIMKNIQLEGYVVNRRGDSVTLDLGVDTGVKTGMQFTVFKEGQEIKHPKTGELLGVERIQTGTVTITEVAQKMCTAQIDQETNPGLVSYGQLVKSQLDIKRKETKLFVNVSPSNARIRILNIGPAYTRGMVLSPGPYNIEISAPGYITKKEWITLGLNEKKTFSFDLVATTTPKKISTSSRPAQDVALTPEQTRFIRVFQSRNDHNMREAAQDITRMRLTDPVILDAVEMALSDGYMHHNSDYEHVDAMSWLCKALGASGRGKYRPTLRSVANNAPNFKLRSYAGRSLREL